MAGGVCEGSYHNLLNPRTCRCSPAIRQSALRNLDLFRGANATTCADLEFLLRSRSLTEGEEVSFPTGDDGLLGILVGGALKIQRWLTWDQYVVVEVLGPGEIFFLGHSPVIQVGLRGYPDVVQSLTTSCVLTMNLGELWPILTRDPVLAPRLLSMFVRRLTELRDHFGRFLVFPAEHRLAHLLLELRRKGRPKADAPGLIPFNLTRKDLAAMCGLALETASRVLSRWEKAGWIRSGRGWVEVLQTAPLEKLSALEVV